MRHSRPCERGEDIRVLVDLRFQKRETLNTSELMLSSSLLILELSGGFIVAKTLPIVAKCYLFETDGKLSRASLLNHSECQIILCGELEDGGL